MLKKTLVITLLFFIGSFASDKKKSKIIFPKDSYVGVEKLFENYTSPILETKLSVKLVEDSKEAWGFYKEQIIEGSKDSVNFAGKFIIVLWGCGSSCETGVIIDASTGKIHTLPTASYGYHFKKNSNLLIVNPPDKDPSYNDRPEWGYPKYFLWKDAEFKLLFGY